MSMAEQSMSFSTLSYPKLASSTSQLMSTGLRAGDLTILRHSKLNPPYHGRIDVNFDVILSEELLDIFGCRKISILKKTLDDQLIPYICDSKGYPMVLRSALEKRLSGPVSNDTPTPTHPTP